MNKYYKNLEISFYSGEKINFENVSVAHFNIELNRLDGWFNMGSVLYKLKDIKEFKFGELVEEELS